MPIATPTRLLPNTLMTTVGIVLKNPPLAIPFMITNTTKGPRELDTGQIANILNALPSKDRRSVLTGPIESDMKPQQRRPTADEKLKPATRPAPAEADRPRELLYNGRKNGGTRRGKVAMAPARKSVVNLTSLNKALGVSVFSGHRQSRSYHSTKIVVLIGARSLISQAAGKLVAKTIRPRIRKVHSTPSL